jgi:hypothetical protein
LGSVRSLRLACCKRALVSSGHGVFRTERS